MKHDGRIPATQDAPVEYPQLFMVTAWSELMTTVTATAAGNNQASLIKTLNRRLLSVMHAGSNVQVAASLDYGSVDKGTTSIFTLTGTVDIAVAAELHQMLLGYLSRKQHIVIYMSDVRQLDSAGAATLLDLYAIARHVGTGFALVAASCNARHTISLCCLDRVLPLFEHMGDAEKYLQELRVN